MSTRGVWKLDSKEVPHRARAWAIIGPEDPRDVNEGVVGAVFCLRCQRRAWSPKHVCCQMRKPGLPGTTASRPAASGSASAFSSNSEVCEAESGHILVAASHSDFGPLVPPTPPRFGLP